MLWHPYWNVFLWFLAQEWVSGWYIFDMFKRYERGKSQTRFSRHIFPKIHVYIFGTLIFLICIYFWHTYFLTCIYFQHAFISRMFTVIILINAPALFNAPLYRPKIKLTLPSIWRPGFWRGHLKVDTKVGLEIKYAVISLSYFFYLS